MKAIAFWLLLFGTGQDWPLPIDCDVPMPPAPFASGGAEYLVYELHLTNLGRTELTLSRVDVLASPNAPAALVSYSGEDLARNLSRPGLSRPKEPQKIAAGLRAILYVWVKTKRGEVPPTLHHRLAFGERSLLSPPLRVDPRRPPVIGPPLRGANWVCGNGPANGSIHRRTLMTWSGKLRGVQRFAIDFLQIGKNGRTYSGDPKKNETYYAYGKEVLAVASGRVVAMQDNIPENVPGLTSRAVKMTQKTLGGNYVLLEIGPRRYAFYAHFQPGKIRVETGQLVREGQVLGLVGNSGNSTEPHLHFHVSDSVVPLDGEGIPYVFREYHRQGMTLLWLAALKSEGERRVGELPLLNEIVRFP